MANDVFVVNSSTTYSDIAAADAAEGGIDYGVQRVWEIDGSVAVNGAVLSATDYNDGLGIQIIAKSGQECDGALNGAGITGSLVSSVENQEICNLNTEHLNLSFDVSIVKNCDIDGGNQSSDCISPRGSGAQTVENTILRNGNNDGILGSANPSLLIINVTQVDALRFGIARGVITDCVSLETPSGDYLGPQTGSSNYWSQDGTGSNTITEGTATDIFENYATGDYRIKAASSPGVAGAGAFINGGSGGVSITATLGTIDYTSQNTTVSLTGSVDVLTTLGAISYSSQNTTVSITGDIDITATLGSINYTSQNTTVSVTGDIDVIATLGTISYSSNDTVVSLTSEIILNATLGTIDYTSQNATVILSGLVDVTATLGAIVYNSYPVIVKIGEGQVIGNVTAGFADDLYKSGFADDIYTAGFKPDTITASFK